MTAALKIKDLHKTYANGPNALKGIDLEVEQGAFFGLLGPNGAGKSTAIGIVCSLVTKTSGTVSVFGHDIDTDRDEAMRYIGLVPQEFNFNIFEKIKHILVNQAGYYGVPRKLAYERAEKYLKKLGLWEKRDTSARTLSGGMKRRLMIARALVHEPKMLILDEPTAGVDIELRRSMWDFLREINAAGTTIILTTHYLEEAESLCKNIAIIDEGKLLEHEKTSVLLRKLNLETFVFYLRDSIDTVPELTDFPTRLIDDRTIEVDIESNQTLNQLIQQLSDQGIIITSMRNKVNRLEELFVKLTSKHGSTQVS